MKKYASVVSFLIVIFAAYWGFYDQKPVTVKKVKNDTEFSIENAYSHLKNFAQEPHHVGTKAHKKAQEYLVAELEKMGLSPSIQTQTVFNRKWFAGTTVENILARIEGKENGKALLVLSHYDSSPNLGMGASDAGSGIVTIVESIRAFLAKGEQPKNDIIILLSDAEELGLLGAAAFVEHHPWAKEVGLVLNFEARGSGGPSYMLMETNGKNSKLISEFVKSNPGYPSSSSLLYSIYKKLPNDTDLTVFRENANINGFNFAFIGDHFDYHTLQDTYQRLDRTTLAHQADYLMTTLNYFANADIENLNSDKDFVYVNFPFVKLLTYPFSWVTPMLIIAIIVLIILVVLGILLNKIQTNELLLGFIPAILSIVLCGAATFFLWKGIQMIYPEYQDMLHGFTYNGYWYIAAFVCFNLWINFLIYNKFLKKRNVVSLTIAPIFIWILINFLIPEEFKGAGFFIIPVFIAEIILTISILWKPADKKYVVLFGLISIPSIYIIAPLVKMFPVGLGLKVLFISAVLIALIFSLLIPVVAASKTRRAFSKLFAVLTLVLFTISFYKSGFSTDNKKPNSLVYIKNVTDSTAYWGTYNRVLDPFVSQKLGENPTKGGIASSNTKSKYNTRFSYHSKADYHNIPDAEINVDRDTVIDNQRMLTVSIHPKRPTRKIELTTKDSIQFNSLKANGAFINKGDAYKVRRGSFLIYHMANSDENLVLEITLDENQSLNFIVNEISYDLLNNPLFSIKPRTDEMMPMPFVTNDAVISTREVSF